MREYHEEFKWYGSATMPGIDVLGPFDTREKAIDALRVALRFISGSEYMLGMCGGNMCYPCKVFLARYEPVKISSWVSIHDAIERANDEAKESGDTDDDRDLFYLNDNACNQLQEVVSSAINRWQKKNKLFFRSDNFAEVKNRETVWVPDMEAEK